MGAVAVDPGPLTLAVAPDQALDRASLHLANALLGNPDSAAGLEILLGGLRLRFVTASALSVTGAEGVVKLNGSELPFNKAIRVSPGAVLEFGPAMFGIRYYLAVQGGIEPQAEPLRASGTLTFGRSHGNNIPIENHAPRRALDPERPVVARVKRGPEAQNYDAGTWLRLTSEPWILSPESDRVGARLVGRPLEAARRAGSAEPATTPASQAQPLLSGSVLLPASGFPVIALAGHPPTSKSPVIAVVRDEDLDLLGQARPGQMVHLLG
ncbi:biotin-dependent carboxyltransferase family protein [Paenarthrobacter aromaticivorans]|uniref:Biotin-dependent carboxyltransferase family protein n=1 Tax=Paenarthrobacter aromaticivorans TaxID=2849150 RepID=A0ABS6I0C6_9MICC|nr:biotin-dependent carboxyltransferase family protein [Paenarthrobacter sp. MMS21-TAE1-1]MBU8865182.1 biotin-dependent carboxyltransferase family protein [Paenarthrobacter sp. MMS21-TAE1-1]